MFLQLEENPKPERSQIVNFYDKWWMTVIAVTSVIDVICLYVILN